MPVRETTVVSRSRRGLSNDIRMSLQVACAGCANRTSASSHDGCGALLLGAKKSLGVSREKQKIRHDLTIPVGWKIFWGTLSRHAFFSNPPDLRSSRQQADPSFGLCAEARRGQRQSRAVASALVGMSLLMVNPASDCPYRSRPNPSSVRSASGEDRHADRRLQPCP